MKVRRSRAALFAACSTCSEKTDSGISVTQSAKMCKLARLTRRTSVQFRLTLHFQFKRRLAYGRSNPRGIQRPSAKESLRASRHADEGRQPAGHSDLVRLRWHPFPH